MASIDITEDIKLEEYTGKLGDYSATPTYFGQQVLEFVAQHFDLRPLTEHGADAVKCQGASHPYWGYADSMLMGDK